MRVRCCHGCPGDYPAQTYTVRGSERPWLDIVLSGVAEANRDLIEGWHITVHRHHREVN